MCQLGWATASWYVVRHYSGCFYEGIFWMKLTFILLNFWVKKITLYNVGRLNSINWVLNRTKTDLSWAGRNSAGKETTFKLQLQHELFSECPAYWPADFGLVCLYNNVSQFLKIKLNHPLSMFTHTHTQTVLFLWRTLMYPLKSMWGQVNNPGQWIIRKVKCVTTAMRYLIIWYTFSFSSAGNLEAT